MLYCDGVHADRLYIDLTDLELPRRFSSNVEYITELRTKWPLTKYKIIHYRIVGGHQC